MKRVHQDTTPHNWQIRKPALIQAQGLIIVKETKCN